MKKIIEQIKKIDGVKTVEKTDDNFVIVTFGKSREKKLIKKAIKKGFLDGVAFEWSDALSAGTQQIIYPLHKDEDGDLCDSKGNYIYVDGDWATIVEPKKVLLTSDDGVNLYDGDEVYLIPFENPVCTEHALMQVYPDILTPLKDNESWCPRYKRFSTKQSAEAWVSSQKPKSLKPEDLVDGEIYLLKGDTYDFIYRFLSIEEDRIRVRTSCCKLDNDYYSCGFFHKYKKTHIATEDEKKQLILAEVTNGYFHEPR